MADKERSRGRHAVKERSSVMCRIRPSTLRLIRILAAWNGVQVQDVLDDLAQREISRLGLSGDDVKPR